MVAEIRRTLRLPLLGVALALGLVTGLSAFTFDYADGTSYLSDDPAACINCHVMRAQYDGWSRGSHQAVATCNDCHTPHRFPDKWLVKGLNGWNHSLAFTTGNFPNTIQIRDFNADVARANCVECHEIMVGEIHDPAAQEGLDCLACHADVAH